MEDAQQKMLLDWMRKIHQLEYAHTYESLKWNRTHSIIGLSAFFLSLIIAFSFRFPGIELETYKNLPFFLRQNFFVALGSTIVALLTGIQTFLKPSQQSELHKKTAMNYEKLRHRIELVLTGEYEKWELEKRIEMLKSEWENLDAINVSPSNFEKGKERVKSFNKYPKELGFLPDIEE